MYSVQCSKWVLCFVISTAVIVKRWHWVSEETLDIGRAPGLVKTMRAFEVGLNAFSSWDDHELKEAMGRMLWFEYSPEAHESEHGVTSRWLWWGWTLEALGGTALMGEEVTDFWGFLSSLHFLFSPTASCEMWSAGSLLFLTVARFSSLWWALSPIPELETRINPFLL